MCGRGGTIPLFLSHSKRSPLLSPPIWPHRRQGRRSSTESTPQSDMQCGTLETQYGNAQRHITLCFLQVYAIPSFRCSMLCGLSRAPRPQRDSNPIPVGLAPLQSRKTKNCHPCRSIALQISSVRLSDPKMHVKHPWYP